MNKKVVLFDIDFTLFNAKYYRDKFVELFQKEIGKTQRNFNQLAEEAYQSSKQKVGYFDPGKFIDELISLLNLKISKEKLEKIVSDQEVVNASLYDDVVTVLTKLSLNNDIILGIFSAGKISIQRPKIKLIEHLLKNENVHIYEFYKGNALPELLEKYKEYKLYFIDDIQSILKNAKDLNPNITTIWIKRRKDESVYKKVDNFNPEYIISSLDELIHIVSTN